MFPQIQLNSIAESFVSYFNEKNRRITITVAVTLTTAFILYDKIVKPPRSLRHIPYIGYWEFLRDSNLPVAEFNKKHVRPLISDGGKASSSGIFLIPGRLGWLIRVADPDSVKVVLYKSDLFPKADIQSGKEDTINAKFYGGSNILVLNGEAWRRQRKIVNPAFHQSMPLNVFGHLVFDVFASIKEQGNTVDIVDLMERYALDVLGKTGFCFDFGAIKNRNNEWVLVYNRIQHALFEHLFYAFPILDQQFRWLFPERKLAHESLGRLNEMLDNIIDDRRRALQNPALTTVENNEKDFLTLMLEKEIDEKELFSKQELRSNLKVFFLAGHETTSSALAFAIYHLAVNQNIQQKAREESIRILGDGKDVLPTIEQMQQMDYISLVIKETLRMHCPLTSAVPRIATVDTVLSGTFIPKGSVIYISPYDLHYNPALWKNPDKFDPDRFESDDETERQKWNTAWVPFGLGGRQCVGMKFTLAQQQVVLSLLLRKYTWKLPQESIHHDKLFTNNGVGVRAINLSIVFEERY